MIEIEKIFNELFILLNNSYSPYSNFKVSAIVQGEDNILYKGVNVENASFGATICAERSAITNCITNGNKKIKSIFLLTDSFDFNFPCGICLQFISEFLEDEGDIFIFSKSNKYKKYKLNQLILSAFNSKDL